MAVICHHTISLDGFIAGPDDSMDGLSGFGKPTALADETMNRIGAIVAGRRWYDLATARWNGVDGIYGGAYKGDVFVLTHRVPSSTDPRIRFLSGSIKAAVTIAQAAAKDKDVDVFGGALTQQCLQAGLLDELILHVVPVLLGGGVRLFEGGYTGPVTLARIQLGEAEQITDLRFRVVH